MKPMKSLLLVLFAITGVSAAQQSTNLKSLTSDDFCNIAGGQAYLNNERRQDYEKLVSDTIKQENTLYGGIFSQTSANCIVQNSMEIDVTRSPSGNYVWAFYYNTYLYSANNVIPVRILNPTNPQKRLINLPFQVIIWNRGSFGTSSDETSLKKVIVQTAVDNFRNFLLEWRLTHPVKQK